MMDDDVTKLEAKQELITLFGNLEVLESAREDLGPACDRILALLRQYPEFAREWYRFRNDDVYPIAILLVHENVPLRLIRLVYDLHPESFRTVIRYDETILPDSRISVYPIDYAISRASEDVVQFVAEQQTGIRAGRRSAINCLFWRNSPLSLETVKILVDKVPEIVAEGLIHTENAISAAFNAHCSLDVLLYFAERHPANNTSLCIDFGLTVTAEKAEQLRRLLPHLTSIVIHAREEAKIQQVLSVLYQFKEGSKVVELSIYCSKVVTSSDLSANITGPLQSLLHSANNTLQRLNLGGFLNIDWPVLCEIFRINLLRLTFKEEGRKEETSSGLVASG